MYRYCLTAVPVIAAALSLAPLLAPRDARSGASTDPVRDRIARYVGTWDVDALLEEPAVRDPLAALLGPRRSVLDENLSVNGGVEYIGGAFAVMGNAPHRGTQDEAIVCIQLAGGEPRVHVALFTKGEVTVYTREERYEYVTHCIKDWITLVNSGHRDRLTKPANVRMVRSP
jgi:hypothetical protein